MDFNKMKRRRIERVDVQVFILAAIIVVVSCSLIFFVNYHLSYNDMISGLRERALEIHAFLDDALDQRSFAALNAAEDMDLPVYGQAKLLLENVRAAAGVRYLYTAKQTADGRLIYLVDGLPDDSADFRDTGDAIEPECVPDLKKALAGGIVLPTAINETTWGPVFISYFPIHNGERVAGAVGIEFEATRQYSTYRAMAIVTPVVIVVFCLIAALAAVCLFRRVSNPFYQDLANTDMLTGLKNRNAFEVDMHNLEQQAGKRPVSLISFDLDNLKYINDNFGHSAGDEYIQTSCKIIRGALSGSGVLYRIGGDEFVVILPENDRPHIEKILEQVARGAKEADFMHEIGISAGYALFEPGRDRGLMETLKRSDAAMYAFKKGRKAERECITP